MAENVDVEQPRPPSETVEIPENPIPELADALGKSGVRFPADYNPRADLKKFGDRINSLITAFLPDSPEGKQSFLEHVKAEKERLDSQGPKYKAITRFVLYTPSARDLKAQVPGALVPDQKMPYLGELPKILYALGVTKKPLDIPTLTLSTDAPVSTAVVLYQFLQEAGAEVKGLEEGSAVISIEKPTSVAPDVTCVVTMNRQERGERNKSGIKPTELSLDQVYLEFTSSAVAAVIADHLQQQAKSPVAA